MAAAEQAVHGAGDNLARRALAHGAVGHAGLAEAASTRTATQHLDGEPILDDAHVGHDSLGDGGRGGEVLHAALEHSRRHVLALLRNCPPPARGALVHHHVVQGGDVRPGDLREAPQDLLAAHTLGAGVTNAGADLDDALLAVPKQHRVQGGRERLAVPGRRTAGKDDRVVLVAVRGPQGNAGQVEGLKHVGGDELVGERETDGVEGGERGRPLKREQRHPPLPHERRHVLPRQEAPLAAHALLCVHGVVEDGDCKVGLADLVDVRVHHGQVEGPLLLLHGAPLVVEVASGVLHVGQQRLDQVKEVLATGPHEALPSMVM